METPYGDPLVRITPFHSLPSNLKKLLGDEFTWASWLQHPFSGYGFFLKAFELGKLTGNYLVEFHQKPKVYTNGYRSPYEKYEQRFPGGIAAMLNALTGSEKMEFRPLVVDRNLMILVRATRSLTRLTMPRSSRDTRLSSWKGMCTERFDVSVTTSRFSPLLLQRRMVPTFSATSLEILRTMRCERIISAEGYPLYDSTLREPFNASYILACLENTLQSTEGQGKDFKSSFARKATSDLIAYERLREKREAELEELYTRPFEDIAVEEFFWTNSPNLRLRRLWSQSRWILPACQKNHRHSDGYLWCQGRNRGPTSG